MTITRTKNLTLQLSNYSWYDWILLENWQSFIKWILHILLWGKCAETKKSLLPKQSKRPGHCACCLAPQVSLWCSHFLWLVEPMHQVLGIRSRKWNDLDTHPDKPATHWYLRQKDLSPSAIGNIPNAESRWKSHRFHVSTIISLGLEN